jgi:Fic-DOC domain mobile mystery protein B
MSTAPEADSPGARWGPQDLRVAAEWAATARTPVLSEEAVRELHRRMFGRLWPWAGEYRTSESEFGAYWTTIPSEVRRVIDDGRFWLSHNAFPVDEAALRLHHRLIQVRAFEDGNARHARMWCDMLLRQHGHPPLSWSHEELSRDGAMRQAYIEALRAADVGQWRPLFSLVLPGRAS